MADGTTSTIDAAAEIISEAVAGIIDGALQPTAQGKLKSLIERIERLEEDKRAVGEDLKAVYGEAKGEGFDVKIIRKVIKLRAQDSARRQEEVALVDLYITAIGGL
jgi:uncharacterized protein (UPF0335 family)